MLSEGSTTPPQPRSDGFSLVEAIIALSILTVLALAFSKGLFLAKVTAEDNLYEATSLTVAISTIEQMKSASLETIERLANGSDRTFYMLIEGNEQTALKLDEPNELLVPITSNSEGEVGKRMPLMLTPSVSSMRDVDGYWLSVIYEYKHPRNDLTRTQVVRNVRSSIPTY